jgi:hypothetical protein
MKYCEMQRLPLPQELCEDHACRTCLDLGEVAQAALNEYPHNTCSSHPVCIAESCTNLVPSPDSDYCVEHSRVQCRVAKCKMFATTEVPFCLEHRQQATKVKNSYSISSCQAMTKRLNHCKGKPPAGSKYCRDHQKPGVVDFMPSREGINDQSQATFATRVDDDLFTGDTAASSLSLTVADTSLPVLTPTLTVRMNLSLLK